MDEVSKTNEELSVEYVYELDMNERIKNHNEEQLKEDLKRRIENNEKYAKYNEEQRLNKELILLREKTCGGKILNFFNRNKKTIKFFALSIVAIPLCVIVPIGFLLILILYPAGWVWYHLTNELYERLTGKYYSKDY